MHRKSTSYILLVTLRAVTSNNYTLQFFAASYKVSPTFLIQATSLQLQVTPARHRFLWCNSATKTYFAVASKALRIYYHALFMPVTLSPVLSESKMQPIAQCALKRSNALHSLLFPEVISVIYYSLFHRVTHYITRYSLTLRVRVSVCVCARSTHTCICVCFCVHTVCTVCVPEIQYSSVVSTKTIGQNFNNWLGCCSQVQLLSYV